MMLACFHLLQKNTLRDILQYISLYIHDLAATNIHSGDLLDHATFMGGANEARSPVPAYC